MWPSDEELMLSYRDGDEDAFDMLYRRYEKPLLNFIYRMVMNTADAESLCQDVFLRVVRVKKDGRTTGPAAMVFGGSGSGEWSPDGTKIAVIHRSDIWIASAEGSEPVQLTKTPERKFGLHWVPGGEMIAYRAYHSQEEQPLMLISASGGAPRKVLDVPMGYAWSPDGKELAFVSERFIMITPIAGGETRRIADLKELGVDEANYGLCWSPDVRKLAFASYNRLTGKPGPGPIFVVSAEGGKVTRLATDDNGQKDYLYWSPDGKWISYNSDAMVKTDPEGAIWEADVSEFLSGGEGEQ